LEKSTSWRESYIRNLLPLQFHLDDADIVIALLDGSQVDDGTALEIGYFYAGKSSEQNVIGIRTDFRRAGLGCLYPIFGLIQKFHTP